MTENGPRLSALTIALHWLIAMAVIGMLAFGLYLEDQPRGLDYERLVGWHGAIGVVVLLAGVLRLGWRLIEGMPAPLGAPLPWQTLLAKAVHWFIIAAIILMPVTGLMMSLGHGRMINVFSVFVIGPYAPNHDLADFGSSLHGKLAKLIIAALVLHVGAALKHHFWDHDGTLKRMLGRSH
jgi:cytochrome b561